MVDTTFFANKENQEILHKCKEIILAELNKSNTTSLENETLKYLEFIISKILKSPSTWDKNCSFSIKEHASKMMAYLNDAFSDADIDHKQCQSAFSYAYVFWREFYISTGMDLSTSDIEMIEFSRNNIDSFETFAKYRINHADKDLTTALFKEILNSNAVDSLRNMSNTIYNAEELTKKWDSKIGERVKSAEKLEESVKKYEDAFNFVGLNKGFSLLLKTKKNERCGLIVIMSVISTLIIGPLIYKLWHLSNDMNAYTGFAYILKSSTPQINISSTMLFLFSAISYIAVMLYFFRVALFNYKSVCAQILQIELRMTLCRFILHYSKHAKVIRDNSGPTLDKFESIIFSGLVANEGDLPATFDGLEHISALLKSFKNP
ncbi:hypothetical protein ACQXXB_11225 [Aeromonas veronii]|uniref:hypothetical protein n=1 Tax=Aeromonas veronii TaxID=654 RepID=UPI003D2D3D13